MKRLLCGLTALLLTAGVHAAESSTYMLFDVGANYIGEITQDFLELPPLPPGVTVEDPRKLKMELGVRVSVAEGFRLNRFLAVEVESGALYNELKGSSDWLVQVPILANLVLRYQCKGGWSGYIGGGGGGSVVIVNSTTGHDEHATIVPAWQGMAGINYQFGNNVSLGVVYKYMGIGSAEIELFTIGLERSKLKDIHNHYGGFQLNYGF